MTLQQLRYLIAISEHGSINAAATALYVSQSNLSTAIKELEKELDISIFTRTRKGVNLTKDGTELLGYARQVIEQADLLEERYAKGQTKKKSLSVSTQHYYFSLQAFINVAEHCSSEKYDFVLRETATHAIIEDVKTFRSDVGILYLDNFNSKILKKAFDEAGLHFYPLFKADAHVFVGEKHPLAKKKSLTLEDLTPFPRYSFEQGIVNSFYYSEEPFGYLHCDRNIRFTDRGTLTNLLTSFNGYTISTGVLSSEMHAGIIPIPLIPKEEMVVGYIMHERRRASDLLNRYIDELHNVIDSLHRPGMRRP